jgi:hypothetical protein
MAPHDTDPDTLRLEHEIVADALASVRLFQLFYGQGAQRDEWIKELVRMLHRHGTEPGRPSILAGAADAIARAYLGQGVEELEWPEG